MPRPFRIAVIWSRFGPYHAARLAAARLLAAREGAEVLGIEIARSDAIYAWDVIKASDGPSRVTLFPDRCYEKLSPIEITSELVRALDALELDAVAINGWSQPEALAAIAWTELRNRVAILMSETKADDMPRVWWKEFTKRWLLKRCDAALVGGAVHGAYLAALGFPRQRIQFGYDVVDNDYFRGGAAEVRSTASSARAASGLPHRYFFVCTRFLGRKNVDGLLKAYALYRAGTTSEPWALVIAGSGVEETRLRSLERELALEGVTWAGFVQYERLPLYYGLASAFVHPAKVEPWGLVINEAIASGLPVIVSRTVGARRELLTDGENGFAFDPFDASDLAAALIRVAEREALERETMGRRSLEIAEAWPIERFGAGLLRAVHMGKRHAGARRAA